MELNYTSLEETEGDQRLLKQVQAHVCVCGECPRVEGDVV